MNVGGSLHLILLASILRSLSPAGWPKFLRCPASALIIDSSPGGRSLRNIINAFVAQVRNPLIRTFLAIFALGLYGLDLALFKLFGVTRRIDHIEEQLLNPSLLPWMAKDTPRLYFFSKKDDMVPWEEVKAHTEKAREAGLAVRTELFEDSPHVAHARKDPERYWIAVQNLWGEALEVARLS